MKRMQWYMSEFGAVAFAPAAHNKLGLYAEIQIIFWDSVLNIILCADHLNLSLGTGAEMG